VARYAPKRHGVGQAAPEQANGQIHARAPEHQRHCSGMGRMVRAGYGDDGVGSRPGHDRERLDEAGMSFRVRGGRKESFLRIFYGICSPSPPWYRKNSL
jgi:hypothetical protein